MNIRRRRRRRKKERYETPCKFTSPGSLTVIESIVDRLAKVQMYIGT